MGGTLLLSIRFETLLSNKQCSLKARQHCNHSEVDTLVYDTNDKACSYKAYVRTGVRALVGHR